MILGKKALKELGCRANDSAGSGYSSFAKRMMDNMGYEEGKGLGKDKQGMSSYIKVKVKDGEAGVGRTKAEQDKTADQWYFTAADSALDAFKLLDTGKKKRKRSRKEKEGAKPSKEAGSGGEDMYTQMWKATGGKRMGMRARGRQDGKLKRCNDHVRHETGEKVEGGKSEKSATGSELVEGTQVIASENKSKVKNDKKAKRKRQKRERTAGRTK